MPPPHHPSDWDAHSLLVLAALKEAAADIKAHDDKIHTLDRSVEDKLHSLETAMREAVSSSTAELKKDIGMLREEQRVLKAEVGFRGGLWGAIAALIPTAIGVVWVLTRMSSAGK